MKNNQKPFLTRTVVRDEYHEAFSKKLETSEVYQRCMMYYRRFESEIESKMPDDISEGEFNRQLKLFISTTNISSFSEAELVFDCMYHAHQEYALTHREEFEMGYECNGYKYTAQPLVQTEDGVVRFTENRIVSEMYRRSLEAGYGLNQVHIDAQKGKYSIEEIEQFNMLTGYSVGGFCEISCHRERIKYLAWKRMNKFMASKELDRQAE